jgi:tetratricopeptide (TPR) repeat protein
VLSCKHLTSGEERPKRKKGFFSHLLGRGEKTEAKHQTKSPDVVEARNYKPATFGRQDRLKFEEKARKAVLQNRMDKAVEYYDKALKIDPRNAQLWNFKGVALTQMNQYTEALACFERAIESTPWYPEPWGNKGYIYVNTGNWTEAVSCCDRALGNSVYLIQSPSIEAHIWVTKGNALLMLFQYKEALDCFNKALELDPQNALAHKGISLVRKEMSTLGGAALGAKVTGVTKTPDFSELEGAYLVRSDPELEKRVNDSLDAIAAQGERGTKALVERLYKDMTLQGNTLVVKNYGEYSWNEWMKRRMIVEALGRAKATNTADALSPLVSARCAEGQFREILQPAVARALAEMKAGTTATQKASAAARVKKGTSPTQQGLTAKEWCDKGFELGTLGRLQEALQCCDKALAIDPQCAKAWNNKGYALARSNRPQEAIQCLDKALAIDPKDADVWAMKGAVLRNFRDKDHYQEAIQCFDKALEINPQLAEACYNKGLTLINLGHHQEGIQCFEKSLEINPQNMYAQSAKNMILRLK